MNSRIVHSVLATKNKAFVLQVPLEVLKKYVPDVEQYCFDVNMNPGNAIEETKLEKIKKIFRDMYVIYDVRPEGYLLKFNSLLYDLLFTLVHSYAVWIGGSHADKSERYLEKLSEIIVYLKENHEKKCSVGEVAKRFGYNEIFDRHGCTNYRVAMRVFKEKYGCTPKEKRDSLRTVP